MSAHVFMAVGIIGMAAAIFGLGWHSHGLWADKQTFRPERHTHRKGTANDRSLDRDGGGDRGVRVDLSDQQVGHGVLAPVVSPPWLFAGEQLPGWAAEAAEYELLHQTAELPASPVEGEPPIDTGELLAITDRVEGWIAQWTAQGNVDRHTIQASDG